MRVEQGNRTSKQCQQRGKIGIDASGPFELSAQGHLGGFLWDNVQRHVTQDGEVIWAVAPSGPVPIFIYHDVERNPPPEAALRGVGVIRKPWS
jgi:hypothetical protein